MFLSLKKKLLVVKEVIEIIDYSDGSSVMNRTNDGFCALELLGLLSKTQKDVIEQMEGLIKPTLVNRTLIVDNNE